MASNRAPRADAPGWHPSRSTGVLRRAARLWPAAVVAAAAAVAALHPVPRAAAGGAEREVRILARQYSYEPHRIVVDAGDVIRLTLASQDVVHGLYLEGHDLEAEVLPGRLSFRVRRPSAHEELREVEEVVFRAGRPGKYRYRCSISCGTLHPFMQGELVVRPNTPFRAGAAAAVGAAFAAFALMLSRRRDGSAPPAPKRVDLFRRFPRLRWLVTRRWFPFALIVPNLIVLFFFLFAGLFGSPIGNRNIIVTIVWIFWWFVLITALVPIGGRSWCLMCPVPALGEWLARRRLVGVRPEAERSASLVTGGLNRRWPRRLRNLWLPSVLFLAMCSFSTILVTRPGLTAVVLGAMVLAALAVHAVYQRRTFCRYLCPLNAWMSLYSMTAMTEVRARDPALCKTCRHACATGTDDAWRCPWLVKNPSLLRRNNYCGLCMECVKACPNRNLTLRARPFCSDLEVKGYDEAWMALIMIALVVAYSVTLLGPWGTVKLWTNVTESGAWGGFALYTAVVWLAALVVLPGLWYLAARLGRRLGGSPEVSTRTLFVRYSYLLVPLGLVAWAAFSFPLIMVNYTHITGSLSDPLGWGWDLFGTANQHWSPLYPEWISHLQIPLLVLGLWIALRRGAAVARGLYPGAAAAARSLIPHGVLCTAFTLGLLRLYAG